MATLCAQELIRARLHCYQAYSIVTLVGFQKAGMIEGSYLTKIFENLIPVP